MTDKRRAKPFPQGCSARKDGYNFSIATKEKNVKLMIYKKGELEPLYQFEFNDEDSVGNLRCLLVSLEEANLYEYNYCLDGVVCSDPYATSIHMVGEEMRTKINVEPFEWEDDLYPNISYDETIAYSLHVKGFTAHWTSKVKHPGTYSGLVEKIEYIKSLGINQLHLMPIYAFDECVQGKKNYWGYGNGLYFAPKNEYAVSDAVLEVKNMIKAFHKEGIEIILEMPFTEGVPQVMMLDALRYWREEYHVDGFILNPYTIDWRMVTTDPALADVKIFKKNDEFQNAMRRFIKSDSGMVSPVLWWSKYIPTDKHTFNYVTSQNGFTLEDLVSFNEKHNEDNCESNMDGANENYSWNCGEEGESKDENICAFRKMQKRNLLFTLLLSQGMPCLLAGDEFGNTQFGNNNPYCQDNEITWLDWNGILDHSELLEFVKRLIAFRKEHSIFSPKEQMDGSKSYGYGIPEISYHGYDAWALNCEEDSRSFGIFYYKKEQVDEFIMLLYNMHWEKTELGLPTLPNGKSWYEAASTEEGVFSSEIALGRLHRVEVGARCVKVIVGK